MKKSVELRNQRMKLITDARALLDASQAAGRTVLNTEERASHTKLLADAEELRQQIETHETQERLDAEVRELVTEPEHPGGNGGEQRDLADRRQRESRFQPYLQRGLEGLRGDPRMAPSYEAGFRSFLASGERRALQADSDPAGGYVMAPPTFVAEIIRNVDDLVFIRSRATKHLSTLAGLGAVSLDADPDDGEWTSELQTGTDDDKMKFGKREQKPSRLLKRVKASNDLLRGGLISVEDLIAERLAYKFAVTQEKNFLLGDGASKPLGIYVASANGIPTDRDVSAGNTATEIKPDNLIKVKYSLKAQYHAKAAWNFHRDAMAMITMMKDGSGQYYLRPSLKDGEPDRLLSFPVDVSEFTPNTFTTGKYVGCLGDFSNYWIADALDFSIQRLAELYAETNQTGFIGRQYVDGMPVKKEAFVRVKLG